MKRNFIKDLQSGDKITNENFAIKSIRKGKTQDGRDYIDLNLSDKTGEIQGKIWHDNIQACQEIEAGEIVELSAQVESFRDKLQLNITFLQKTQEFDLENFLPKSEKDLNELWKQVKAAISEVNDGNIKKLLNYFYTNKEFTEKFKTAPGAEVIHHAYIGGLMEHIVEMLEINTTICNSFPSLNKDLMIAGILLHDIGKMEELNVTHTIHRTLEGYLIGHITLGAITTNKAIETIKEFPEKLQAEIIHLILSHHGKLEFGSPVKPMTKEAITLGYIDNLSAKTKTAIKVYNENQDGETLFSNHNFALETKLYLD